MSDTAPQMGSSEKAIRQLSFACGPLATQQHVGVEVAAEIARERDAAYAALERQRDALLADVRELAYILADMNNILAPPCGEAGAEDAYRKGMTAGKILTAAIAAAEGGTA